MILFNINRSSYYDLRWQDEESMEIFHMLKSKFVNYSRLSSNISSDEKVSQYQDNRVQDIYSNEKRASNLSNRFQIISQFKLKQIKSALKAKLVEYSSMCPL